MNAHNRFCKKYASSLESNTKMYPHISCVGYADHSLQNLIKDVMTVKCLKNIHI